MTESSIPPAVQRNELRVTLLPALLSEGVASLERWSAELSAALRTIDGMEIAVAKPPDAERRGGKPIGSRGGRTMARFVSYPRAVRRERADIFHIIDQGYAHLARALPVGRTVVTCHDLMPLLAANGELPFRVGHMTLARYRASVAWLRTAAHVACVSESTRNDVIRLTKVSPDRTSVIPNGLSAAFKPADLAQRSVLRKSFPPGALLMLQVSSGFPYKNVEGAIETFAQLRAADPAWRLLRVGTPLSPEQRAQAVRIGVSDAIEDLGRVSDVRLIELYNLVDVVLVPSHWEGFGRPAIEALACGAPVVTSTAPALLEAVAGAALSAPADDPAGLAATVARLLGSAELRQDLRTRGLARAAELSWASVARDYAALYRTVAAAP